MATTAAVNVPVDNTSNGSITTEKITTRGYFKLKEDGIAIDKIYARAEIKDHSNWEKLEEQGFKKWNENQFIRYTLKTEEAFALLVPDAQRRMEIIQDGINYVQNSRMNALAILTKDGTGENGIAPEPDWNDEVIDLKEYINQAKVSKRLSPDDQLERTLKNTGLSDDMIEQMLQAALARRAARAAQAAPQMEASPEEEPVA